MSSGDTHILDERMLLGRISSGDEHAFRVIYDRYRKKIYSYALKILKDEDRSEDIVHEVFLCIWQHSNLGKIENLESYLRVIVRNATLKLLRREKLERKVNTQMFVDWDEMNDSTEQVILWKDTRKLIQEAVDYLPPQQKIVFQLCREEGLKYEEVAERMDISRLTVKTHMQHALRFLRAYVSRHTDVTLWVVLVHILVGK